jgi:DNA-binding IclR family transcriptional regulator
VLVALREALPADGAPVRLRELARRLDADPAVVRSLLEHAVARGWLPDLELRLDEAGCATAACVPDLRSLVCRGCPVSGREG